MFDDDYLLEEDKENSVDFIALMEKKGIAKPVLRETSELNITDPENLEKQRNDFLMKKFSSSPVAVLETALEDRNPEKIKEIEYGLLTKYQSFNMDEKKHFLQTVHKKYMQQRIEMYTLLNQIDDGNLSSEGAENLALEITGLSEKNIILRDVVQRVGIKIYDFTNISKFNKFPGSGALMSLAGFSFTRDVKIICPKCGNLIETKIVDLNKMYHPHAIDFVLNLHGKLAQDCDKCDWFFFYDVDAMTNFKGVKKILSEEPKIMISKINPPRVTQGKINSRNSIKFLLPMEDGDTRENLMARWESIINTNLTPTGMSSAAGKIFTSRKYELEEQNQVVEGIELGLVLNDHVVVTLSLAS